MVGFKCVTRFKCAVEIKCVVGIKSWHNWNIIESDIKHLLSEEFEDTKGAIRICISKKNRQHNGQKKKYKRTNNDQQNIHIKLKIE
jgi:hypothetical protein